MKAEKYNIAWILLLVCSFGRGSDKEKRKENDSSVWMLLIFLQICIFLPCKTRKLQFEKQVSFQATLLIAVLVDSIFKANISVTDLRMEILIISDLL